MLVQRSIQSSGREKLSILTPFPSEGNDISGALAHHLGDVEGTVGLIGYSDRAIDCLSLYLQTMTDRNTAKSSAHTQACLLLLTVLWI